MKLPMARLQIIGLKQHLEPTVRTLHGLGCIQVEDLSAWAEISARPWQLDEATIRQRESTTRLVAEIEGLLSILETDANQTSLVPPSEVTTLDEIQAGLQELMTQIQALVARQEALAAEQASLPRYEATLRKLLPLVPPAANEPGNAFFTILVSRSHRWVLGIVMEAVLESTQGRAEMASGVLDEATQAMIVIVPGEFSAEIEQLLGREDISRLRLPDEIAGQPPEKALLTLEQRLAAIPAELAQIKDQLASLAESWRPPLWSWRNCLRDRLDEIAILERFGETEQTFILAGWAPERDIPQVRQALATQVGEALILQTIPLTAADRQRAPVVLVNPAPIRPFQSLVRLLSLPRYDGLDPTPLMAFFLPLFFGMILGDVGYGGLLLLLCLYGLRRFKQPGTQRDIIHILTIGSVWGIVFGFLYGEAFGMLGEQLGMHALWFERARATEITSLLLFAVAVGAAHIVLGLLLGVWEAVRQRQRHHLLERGGMLLGLFGLFLLVAVLAERLPTGLLIPAVAMLIIGIVLLSSSMGWIGILLGPIEFIGLLGNILSYLRITAVGLASVYVAKLANDLAGTLGSIIIGVLIAVLFHALNLVLGAFSPTIHSMRLHYVEFFRKFYEGGGRPFEPFKSVSSNQSSGTSYLKRDH
jgi:V/A-type H+-transporting ATPase subunit I